MSINREQLEAQLSEIARRRKLAEQMSRPPERTQQAGGMVVPYSAGEGLAQLGQAFIQRRSNKKLDEQEKTARAGYATSKAQALEALGNAYRSGNRLQPEQAQGAIDMGIDPSVAAQPTPIKVGAGDALIDPNTHAEIYRNPAAATGGNSRYGNPQIGPDGKIIVLDRATGEYIDTGKDASANQRLVTMPDGSVISVDMRKPSTSGEAPATATVVTPERAAQAVQDRKSNEQVGEARGTAIANLPLVQSTARQALMTVDKLLEHPGRATATGLSGKVDPRNYVPGTDAYNFDVMRKQALGQVFLDAYQSLKGGGAITNIEGEKAEQAKARMDRAQSDEEFVSALQDYKGAIQRGLALAEQKTQLGTAPPVPSAQPDINALLDKYAPAPAATSR